MNGDLVLGGVGGGQRFEDGTMAALGLQQFTKFPEHNFTVGSNTCVSAQAALRDVGELGEDLLGFRVLCEQTVKKRKRGETSKTDKFFENLFVFFLVNWEGIYSQKYFSGTGNNVS